MLAAGSMEELVQSFILVRRDRLGEENQHYRSLGSLPEAISVAALSCLPNGKRHSHQYRIRRRVLEALRDGLGPDEVRACRSFDELHDLVAGICDRLHGAGELLAYDVAQRLGAHLGLAPRRVYLHSGTRKGARALGLDHKRASLGRSDLPAELRRLTCSEVEDFLCIYKGRLAGMQPATSI
jgi:hypothetical protein